MDTQTGLRSDHILGYRMIQKIGSGGFGEVWRAEAPGGLLKAVKLLYGYHDERRARDELKSLDRIKQLRHPFLLSLERIEVVDRQLVVISELADRSLADVFESHVRAGRPGIPREELLQYLRNAAEALDFLAVEHGLQHLDVKPENLLLVGKHAKLADFGLVKDLRESSESLMSGLTPSFSAPELFDGRPGLRSDQYALAIVYQEMLTGKRPFTGSTLAQLASQHMHAQPDLSPLSKSDQAVIGRALAKDPAARYPLCRLMVEDLINQRAIVRQAKRRTIPGRATAGTVAQAIKPRTGDTSRTRFMQTAPLAEQASALQIADSSGLELAPAGIGPTLLIGVGRTANRILQRYKHLVQSRKVPLDQLPAIKLLGIDTERPEGERGVGGVGSIPLDGDEQVLLPLRKPEEYRTRCDKHKRWLNRRWIYNVPKTLQTEGLRPLGRLAMIDNFPALCESLENAIEQISQRDSLALTADRLGMEPQAERPRVVLLSSVSGGLGSGMTLDLAFALRLILDEHSLGGECLTSILMHATQPSVRDHSIAIANTFAFLTELRHLTQSGYPGEESCGLPPIADQAPFDFPYFLHLGDGTPDEEWERRLDSVAEYLFLNTVNPSAGFFDSCRARELDLDHFSLRSFGVSSVGPSLPGIQSQLSELVRNHMVARWRRTPDPVDLAERIGELEQLLDPPAVRTGIEGLTDGLCPAVIQQEMAVALADWATQRNQPEEELENRLAAIDGLLGEAPKDARSQWSGLTDCLKDSLQGLVAPVRQKADQWMATAVGGTRLDLGGTLRVLQGYMEQVEQLRTGLSTRIQNIQVSNLELVRGLRSLRLKASEKSDVRQLALELGRKLLENRILQIRMRLVSEYHLMVSRRLGEHRSKLQQDTEEITSAIQSRDVELSERAVIRRFQGLDQLLVSELLGGLPGILDGVEMRLYAHSVANAGGFWKLLQNPGFARRYLPNAIERAIQEELAAQGRTINLDAAISGSSENKRITPVDELRRMIASALDSQSHPGGVARLLVATPAAGTCSHLLEEVRAIAGAHPGWSATTSGNLVMAAEIEDVPLAGVAQQMLSTRSDCLELARRLTSRCDVEWPSLEDLL